MALTSCVIPRLRSLRLKFETDETPEYKEAITRFLVQHPTIEKLKWDNPFAPIIDPTMLPHLQEMRGLRYDSWALRLATSGTANPARPLKNLEFPELDEDMVSALEAGKDNLPFLRRLAFVSLSVPLTRLAALGKSFPNLAAISYEAWDSEAFSLVSK